MLDFLAASTKSNTFANTKRINISFPSQRNSYDCGLYVCVLMKVLLSKIDKGFSEKEKHNVLVNTDMRNERKNILSELFCGKLFIEIEKPFVGIFYKDPIGNSEIVSEKPLWLLQTEFVDKVKVSNKTYLKTYLNRFSPRRTTKFMKGVFHH